MKMKTLDGAVKRDLSKGKDARMMKKTMKIECAQGVKAPKLKLVESTYPVEEEVGVVDGEGNPVMDAETGLQVTETKTVDYPCQRIEATWMNGFTITLR
ncbi:MAG: hypothetical protein ACI4TC_02840 [Kiritimatiellia bacterium]